MFAVEPLSDFAEDDVRRLIVGYETSQIYRLTKREDASRTEIALELVDQAFEKVFPMSDTMIGWYRGVLGEGLSFAAVDAGEMVGITIAQRQWNGIAMVWELHVAPTHRRQGAGRALLEAVEGAASSSGLRAVSIETQTSNVGAITFYRACGYAVGAVDLSFYRNDDAERGEAAVFMKKPLSVSS